MSRIHAGIAVAGSRRPRHAGTLDAEMLTNQ